jgi:hypothetical protein
MSDASRFDRDPFAGSVNAQMCVGGREIVFIELRDADGALVYRLQATNPPDWESRPRSAILAAAHTGFNQGLYVTEFGERFARSRWDEESLAVQRWPLFEEFITEVGSVERRLNLRPIVRSHCAGTRISCRFRRITFTCEMYWPGELRERDLKGDLGAVSIRRLPN